MLFRPPPNPQQLKWLRSKGWKPLEFIARGRSSGIWKVIPTRSKKSSIPDTDICVAKCEHRKSFRNMMAEKEVMHLRAANKLGIGPRLMDWDADAGVLVMEWIDGPTLNQFLREEKDPKKVLRVLHKLFVQARKLDKAGLDHGQLGGKLVNILIGKKDTPVIIDFEKASQVRKPHNESKLQHVLLGGGTAHSARIRVLLGEEINRLLD